MADLRIVDAPLLSTVKGTEKIPTGGEGNFSISVNQVADFAKLKWFLATEEYVDNAASIVQADLNLHKNSVSNPHQVTKEQVGLGNVDNTADLDKPVSNATQSAIITANSVKADKSYVDSQDQLKADKSYVDTALSNLSTTANKYYSTLAAANTDIANIALNQSVTIGEAVNSGLWEKKTAGATTLTKSPYDPLAQAKADATAKADAAKAEIFSLIPDKLLIDLKIAKQLVAKDFVVGEFNSSTYSLYKGYLTTVGDIIAFPNSTTLAIPILSGFDKVIFNIGNPLVRYAFWDEQGVNISGKAGAVKASPTIPTNAAVLAITINNGGDRVVDLDNDLVSFSGERKPILTTKSYVDNKLSNVDIMLSYADSKLSNYLTKNLLVNRFYLSLRIAKQLAAKNFVVETFNSSTYTLYNGYVTDTGGLASFKGSSTLAIPILSGHSKVIFNIKNPLIRYAFWDKQGKNILGKAGAVSTNPIIPANAAVLAITINNGEDRIVDLDNDLVSFETSTSTSLATIDYVHQLVGASKQSTADVDKYAKIMLGKKLYTFIGDDMRLYKESLFSGYNPVVNYSIEFSSNSVIQDKGRYGAVLESGNFTVDVFDENRNLIDVRTSVIYRKPKPTTLNRATTPQNKMKVLFIGDSLIHFNQNLIGKEWLRMLNTDQPRTVNGGVVYPSTYKMSDGNIELVGNRGDATQKHEIGNKLSVLMTGTGTGGSTTGNPFYNPDSTEPNVIGADGWNKRVDIARYFQEVCGVGEHPDYIYLACGVNDIVDYNWDINALPDIRAKMKSLLGRIKVACDVIAGGNSNVQILLFNHQYYPLNRGAYSTFKPAHQRRVWTEHYRQYEDMVTNDVIDGVPLSSFVRFVDCASSFDVDNGYAYSNKTVNPRSEAVEVIVVDTVHMGAQGAAMYADALLRDFLYHECS